VKFTSSSAVQYYPKSFLKLLLTAFALVSLPLMAVFVSAALHVDRITEQSRNAVSQAAQAARGSRDLAQQVESLERVVRQYLILGDRDLLRDYDTLRERFKATTSVLSLLPLDEAQLRELNRTIEREQQLYELLNRGPVRPADRNVLVSGYVGLSELARGVLDISNTLIDREIDHLSESASEARRVLLWQFGAAFPLGILLAVGVTFLIARPIRQIDDAVRKLGEGRFDEAVLVRGPADLEYLGARLDWLRRHLMELEREKERFLRHVSHELKTPLTSLREGSELLADGSMGVLTPPQREVAGILRDKSVLLQNMIERLLQVQRATGGLSNLHREALQLNDVVEGVVRDHSLAAEARGIRIVAPLSLSVLRADRDKLRVIIDNLLSNAIKYSPDGAEVVVESSTQGGRVVIEVSDNGPGVPASERDRIFDWFYQGDGMHGGRVAGSGLGLAIVRELVLAHHGQIEVVDDDKPGARFRVTLPA
jgi:two-component system sensor histidine kinase GlrK